MTRLKNDDICDISSGLTGYNRYLLSATGRSLLGIACHSWDADEAVVINRIKQFSIHVIPVTAGLGIISDFSQTVCSILKFLGFSALVTDQTDTAGIAQAFEKGADGIMMADDHRFVGINLNTREIADNSEATGKVFAAALDLLTGKLNNQPVLIMGCGPVGEAAAWMFLQKGCQVALCDKNPDTAMQLKKKMMLKFSNPSIEIIEDLAACAHKYPNILEATSARNTIPDTLITDQMHVSAPGVPLGLTKQGCVRLKGRLVHDKLELGVAAMAVKLVIKQP